MSVGRYSAEENDAVANALDELSHEGVRRMLTMALEIEADEYVQRFVDDVDDDGLRLVVRNGHAKPRDVRVGTQTMRLRAPRVNDRRIDERSGERRRFRSRVSPAYARRSPTVTDRLAFLYLCGLATGDFGPSLRELLGTDGSGLSAGAIARVEQQCQVDRTVFATRSLRFRRYPYLILDAIHMSVEERLCMLLVVAVRAGGEKELLAVGAGYHECTNAWSGVLRDLRERGLTEPELVAGDGALGAWAALAEVFPAARERRAV